MIIIMVLFYNSLFLNAKTEIKFSTTIIATTNIIDSQIVIPEYITLVNNCPKTVFAVIVPLPRKAYKSMLQSGLNLNQELAPKNKGNIILTTYIKSVKINANKSDFKKLVNNIAIEM